MKSVWTNIGTSSEAAFIAFGGGDIVGAGLDTLYAGLYGEEGMTNLSGETYVGELQNFYLWGEMDPG